MEKLQLNLFVAYTAIQETFGYTAAVQAVGQLLVASPVIDIEPESAESESPFSSLAAAPIEPDLARSALSKLALAPQAATGKPCSGSRRWQRAALAVRRAPDPWEGRRLHTLPLERCVRHRYNPEERHWETDDVLVRMELQPFAAGAMRECYAMKKLSTFGGNNNWKHAQNCVAKLYKKTAHPSVYWVDVLVQMESKRLSEEYNKTNPPKHIDMMQAALVEFPDRQGNPIFALEQLLTGNYIKYNSNSGFVRGDELLRYTPQAFSHFTYSWSKGQRICVDVQGVGDMYTDPQIHTLDGENFGDGNLGLRGMSLFFRTHQCNPLCARLHLKPFDRCSSDIKAQGYTSESSHKTSSPLGRTMTVVRRMPSLKRKPLLGFGGAVEARVAPAPHSLKGALELLKEVPTVESPESLLHMEVAKLYAEVVLLPDLRPAEDPEDALKGGIFHLYAAAQQGCVFALVLLARIHSDLELINTAFAHLAKAAKKEGEVVCYPDLAWRATLLAAERGVGGAATAVAHAYANAGQGLAAGIKVEANAAEAFRWYTRALAIEIELAELYAAADKEAKEDEEVDEGVPDFKAGLEEITEASENEEDESEDPDDNGDVSAPDGSVGGIPGSASTMKSKGGIITIKLPPLSAGTSAVFTLKLRLAAEEEAADLPYAAVHKYEIQAAMGNLLMEGGTGLEVDATAAAEHFNLAATLAEHAGKGRLAMTYYELVAQAESM